MNRSENAVLFFTHDLDQFRLLKENRVMTPAHVQRMATSLKEHGFLKSSPITTVREGNAYIVTDGQHRLEAAKQLGMGVYFTVDDSVTAAETARRANVYSKTWIFEDFVHHYCERGNEHYRKLRDFARTYSLPISNAIDILDGRLRSGGKMGKSSRIVFREGTWETSQERIDAASAAMRQVNEIRNFNPLMDAVKRDKAFISACLQMVTHAGYIHMQFLRHLELHLQSIHRCGSARQYLEMLTEIHNYKQRLHRPNFTRKV